jgi:hypothetical protein
VKKGFNVMTELKEITSQLEKPFDISDIKLLPKAPTKDGTKCLALPYADPRVYQDRLNKVCPGEWSTPAPVSLSVGNKIIVYVTVVVCGVEHTDVGEALASSENAGTESHAQAFKRACSQFGLGRYLYDLEKEYVPYNRERKVIALKPEEIQGVVRKMYAKAGIPVAQPQADKQERRGERIDSKQQNTNPPPAGAEKKDPPSESALKAEFTKLGIRHKDADTLVTWNEFLKAKLNVSREELREIINRELTLDECNRLNMALQPYRDMLATVSA